MGGIDPQADLMALLPAPQDCLTVIFKGRVEVKASHLIVPIGAGIGIPAQACRELSLQLFVFQHGDGVLDLLPVHL